MESAVKKFPKPVLRGYCQRFVKKHLAIAAAVGISSALAYRFLYSLPRMEKEREFFRTYDADKAFNRMMKAGALYSFAPDGTPRFNP